MFSPMFVMLQKCSLATSRVPQGLDFETWESTDLDSPFAEPRAGCFLPYFTLTFGSTLSPGRNSWFGSSFSRLVKSMRTGTRCTTLT